MTQKKDRRSARTKKREVFNQSLIAGVDSCEPGCDQTVKVSWTPPSSSRRVNEFFDFTNPDTGCLSRINSVPPGFLIGGCRPDGVPVIIHAGGGVQFGWLSTWPSMPSWPRGYSSCVAMSPGMCQ